MLGDITSWQELHYEVIDEEKALKYCPADYDQRKTDADELTRRFLQKMDGQMQTNVTINSEDIEDFGGFYNADKPREINRVLSDSKSAKKLHAHLKEICEISVE